MTGYQGVSVDAPRRSLRVLMGVPQYPYPVVGGMERQAHELAKALIGLGVHVQAISGRVEAGQPASELVEGVLVHRTAFPSNKFFRFIRTPWSLLRIAFKNRGTFDVVHIHQFSWFGLFLIVISRALGKPVLTKLLGIRDYGLPGLRRSAFGKLRLAIFMQSDGVVAMCRESLGELREVGFPAERVLRTPNGITSSCKVRQGSGKTSDIEPCRVVFVGRLTAEKRVRDLLEVWARIDQDLGGKARLELWGDGPLRPSLEALCEQLDLAATVTFCGSVESVRDKLALMDILVLPSSVEGNSNAILEGMAAGLPIVSTRVGGTPLLVGEDGSGLLCDPGDQDALYRNLTTLIEDGEYRAGVGSAMRRRIQAEFDMDRIAERYARAYELLLAGNRDRLVAIGSPLVVDE